MKMPWKPLRFGRPGQDEYLWRLNLLRLAGYSVKLHRFLRSDLDECLHDHPWPFATLILSGGYYELTEKGRAWHSPGSLLVRPAEFRHRVIVPAHPCGECDWCCRESEFWGCSFGRIRLLGRPPPSANGCESPRRVIPWTLFFAGRKCRSWGFWTTRGFVPHGEFTEC